MRTALGLVLQLGYQIEYHYFMRISLRSWLWAVVLVPLGAAAIGRLSWTPAIAVSAAGVLFWALGEWAKRRGYAVFRPGPLAPHPSSPPPLDVDEPLACRASGAFAVERNERTMLNEPARVFYVHTREHIVQVHLQRSRFLLLAPSLPGEEGYWYVFFQLSSVEQVQVGEVQCFLRWDPALAITYRSQERDGRRATVYLAFSGPDSLHRVLAELRVHLPQEALA
jgi:hypothetical protein